jgi:hypothetical protein
MFLLEYSPLETELRLVEAIVGFQLMLNVLQSSVS